jgi:hypothetical protein
MKESRQNTKQKTSGSSSGKRVPSAGGSSGLAPGPQATSSQSGNTRAFPKINCFPLPSKKRCQASLQLWEVIRPLWTGKSVDEMSLYLFKDIWSLEPSKVETPFGLFLLNILVDL